MPAKNIYHYPLHDDGDYKGRIRFTLFAESYLNTGLSDVLKDKKDDFESLKQKRRDLISQAQYEAKQDGVAKDTTREDLS